MVVRDHARNWRQRTPIPGPFSWLFDARALIASGRIHSPFMVDFAGSKLQQRDIRNFLTDLCSLTTQPYCTIQLDLRNFDHSLPPEE
jgi:hypothetical protein